MSEPPKEELVSLMQLTLVHLPKYFLIRKEMPISAPRSVLN